MRHGKKFNHLGRKSAHRKAMLANMACSLIEHKRIRTTLAKAKALRPYVEPLITKARKGMNAENIEATTHSHRVVFSYLKNKHAVRELFREVVPKVGERQGGYTRILKIGNRLGDNAEMAIIELVDFNELAPGKVEKSSGSRRKRRRGGRRGGSSSSQQATSQATEANKAAEAVAEQAEEEVAETSATDNAGASTEVAKKETDEVVNDVDSAEDETSEDETKEK